MTPGMLEDRIADATKRYKAKKLEEEIKAKELTVIQEELLRLQGEYRALIALQENKDPLTIIASEDKEK